MTVPAGVHPDAMIVKRIAAGTILVGVVVRKSVV